MSWNGRNDEHDDGHDDEHDDEQMDFLDPVFYFEGAEDLEEFVNEIEDGMDMHVEIHEVDEDGNDHVIDGKSFAAQSKEQIKRMMDEVSKVKSDGGLVDFLSRINVRNSATLDQLEASCLEYVRLVREEPASLLSMNMFFARPDFKKLLTMPETAPIYAMFASYGLLTILAKSSEEVLEQIKNEMEDEE